ncbi:methylmalonyl-CoA mutase family protein [Bacillus sp. FJAT-27225]|uniref:methylmalonyl-CoA mutase family protein n=1 Tax=Bacillus sp. FJAT-27225 TaxID=1743144 RepID=UPI0015864FD1|nr:methylmalonyl-CoA mutase family protein [Bacillus sp. FJAT-27225]
MNYQFKNYTLDEWKDKAEQALKGNTADSLSSVTYEDIILKPLYTAHDKRNPGFSGKPDYRRGIYPNGYQDQPWLIAQKIQSDSAEKLKEKLEEALGKGQTAIALDSDRITPAYAEVLAPYARAYPFAIKTNIQLESVLEEFEKRVGQGDLTGYIAYDPISVFEKPVKLEAWAETVKEAAIRQPGLRTVMIDTGIYHMKGANAVQELAAAAASGVLYLESLLDAGMALNDIVDKFIFTFQIGTEFFMEIAKLRAARIIWDRITEEYGTSREKRKMVISSETSKFTQTLFDPHVNLLRTGNQAFAAVLGGIQYLHVEPYDSLTGITSFSERIARNMPLILREEAHLDKVADPGGGSWFIEELTEQLAEKAWALFQKIDQQGGMLASIQSGWFLEEVEKTLTERLSDIKARKRSIIGTNVYANLAEDKPKPGIIKQARLSAPYEELRLKAIALEESGVKTAVGLICFGGIKDHKPRADFVEGFLSPGGIRSVRSDVLYTLEDVIEFVEASGLDRFCVCSSNELYNEAGLDIAKRLKENYPGVSLYLAGQPENKLDWEEAGIKGFLHAKANCYQFLSDILSGLEVSADA